MVFMRSASPLAPVELHGNRLWMRAIIPFHCVHGIMGPVKENDGRSGHKAVEMDPADHADDIEVE